MEKINNALQSANRISLSTIIFLISIIVILVYLSLLPASLKSIGTNPDFIGAYAPTARNILLGNGFILANGTSPAICYPPGYPIILAGIFKISDWSGIDSNNMLYIFNIVASSFVAVIIFLLASAIWGHLPGIIVSLIWITYPLNLWLNGLTCTEIPFMAFFLGSIYTIVSSGLKNKLSGPSCFIAGILMGAAMLIRPIAIGMSFIIGLIIWLFTTNKKKLYLRLFLIIAVFAGNLMIVYPWEAWMFKRTGKILPLCMNAPLSIADGLTFAVDLKEVRQGVNIPADVRKLQEDINRHYERLETLSGIAAVLAENLRTQPYAVFKLFLIKMARSWYGTDSQKFETLILLIQSIYLVFILLATWMVGKMGGTAKRMVLGIWLIVFYFWGMSIISLSLARYMVPIMGLLFLFLPPVFQPSLKRYQLPLPSFRDGAVL